ncbi:MAG: hypothetical protein ACMUHU_07610, partial [Thermoplasmatota archaeon]
LYGEGTYGLELDLLEIPRDNNDERNTADQIVPGVIYGTVNEKYNDEKDWYEMKIGPDTQLLVKFQRTEGVQQLSLHVYVEGSNYRVIGLDLYSTQDLTQGTWTNLDGSEKKLAIVVSGDGDYSFNITVSPVFRDHNDELENATEIFEGNTTGSVNFGEQYYDQLDYLFLKIEPMTTGHIWIWMVGKESRDISVKFYDQMMVIIEGENRYMDEENAGTYIMFRNEENQTTRSYIGISGKGEYLIHLEKEPIIPEEPKERPDADGDGVPDLFDHFPNDKNEWNDTDNDGYGDNSDAFPYDKKEHFDTDLDGVGDNSDAFPNDKSASRDSDGDGHPDIWNPGMKDRSTTGLTLDQYPYDKDRWEIEEPEKADDRMSVGSIIMYLMIGLAAGGFLMFILLRRPRKEEYREE